MTRTYPVRIFFGIILEVAMKPLIDKEKCAAQPGICPSMKICDRKAIKFQEDENEPLGGRMEIDYSQCNGCGACIAACCGKAISAAAT